MSLEKLVQLGWYKTEPSSSKEIADLFSIVDRSQADLKVEGISDDLRFQAAYNGVLTLANIALRASGFRVSLGQGHHQRVIESLEHTHPAKPRSLPHSPYLPPPMLPFPFAKIAHTSSPPHSSIPASSPRLARAFSPSPTIPSRPGVASLLASSPAHSFAKPSYPSSPLNTAIWPSSCPGRRFQPDEVSGNWDGLGNGLVTGVRLEEKTAGQSPGRLRT